MWHLIYRQDTGSLVSETSIVPPNLDMRLYSVLDVDERPDWTVKAWNPETRQLYDRPLPVLIDRLDDIEALLLADDDFLATWNNLNATRKGQVRAGLRRVFAYLLGTKQFRRENEKLGVD